MSLPTSNKRSMNRRGSQEVFPWVRPAARHTALRVTDFPIRSGFGARKKFWKTGNANCIPNYLRLPSTLIWRPAWRNPGTLFQKAVALFVYNPGVVLLCSCSLSDCSVIEKGGGIRPREALATLFPFPGKRRCYVLTCRFRTGLLAGDCARER